MSDWLMQYADARRFNAAAISSTLTKTRLDAAGLAFGWLLVLAISAYGLVKPAFNWDMVAYVATALENRIDDPRELHTTTWQVIREHASEGRYYELSSGNAYNRHQYENPESFASQLSMYRVKPAYVWTIRAFEPSFGLKNAALLASVMFTLAFGGIVLALLRMSGAAQAAFVLFPVLLVGDYLHMTVGVLPDMMLAAVALAAVVLHMGGKVWAGCALLFLSLLVRPDNIIMVFALLIAFALFRLRVLPLAITFVAGFATISLLSKAGGHPGWWAHFWFSCIELQNTMTGFDPEFSIADMAKGYARGISVALRHSDWPSLYILLLACWALLARYGLSRDRMKNALLFAMAIGVLGKFASFPLPDDRFYFVFIGTMAVILATMWKPQFQLAERPA